MLRNERTGFAVVALATLLAAGLAMARNEGPKSSHDAVTMGEPEAKQLALLMDEDKNGKVSRAEFMKFMEAEFNRLDKDKNGALDVEELSHSVLMPSRAQTFSSAGK